MPLISRVPHLQTKANTTSFLLPFVHLAYLGCKLFRTQTVSEDVHENLLAQQGPSLRASLTVKQHNLRNSSISKISCAITHL